MSDLELPFGGSSIAGGNLPVTDSDDVLRVFSDAHRRPESAPVRDAFTEAFAAGHIAYQDAVTEVIAQTDPDYATGDYLVEKALERGVAPFASESEPSLRDRMFAVPAIVTPQAIVDTVNEIIAPYTDQECQFLEPELDGLFIHDGTVTAWDSFIGAAPRYPDRYYPHDASENAGFFLENNNPGTSIVSSGYPRNFHIRIPFLTAADDQFAYFGDGDSFEFIPDGTNASGSELNGVYSPFIYQSAQTSEELYSSIVSKVQSIKGQGMSWSLIEENQPNL